MKTDHNPKAMYTREEEAFMCHLNITVQWSSVVCHEAWTTEPPLMCVVKNVSTVCAPWPTYSCSFLKVLPQHWKHTAVERFCAPQRYSFPSRTRFQQDDDDAQSQQKRVKASRRTVAGSTGCSEKPTSSFPSVKLLTLSWDLFKGHLKGHFTKRRLSLVDNLIFVADICTDLW